MTSYLEIFLPFLRALFGFLIVCPKFPMVPSKNLAALGICLHVFSIILVRLIFPLFILDFLSRTKEVKAYFLQSSNNKQLGAFNQTLNLVFKLRGKIYLCLKCIIAETLPTAMRRIDFFLAKVKWKWMFPGGHGTTLDSTEEVRKRYK